MREDNEYGGGRSYGGPRRTGGYQRNTPPVSVGEELDVVIEAVGEKGDGIAKKNGFVLFIPGVKAGENVKIRVTKVFRKVGFAEVVGKGEAPAGKSEEAAPEESESFGEEDEASEETKESEETEESEEFGGED
jgi:predicted RNA-binding protein with TRAM domain